MNVEIRVYNPSLELQGIIDEFSCLIWIRRYQAPGEFEIHTPYSDESKGLLLPENIVQRYDGKSVLEAGVIEDLTLTKNEIIAKGRFLESYLERRLIKETTYYSGNAEDSMRSIISNMVEIPMLELGTDQGLTETLRFQATYKTVLSIIEKVCKATSLGFRIRPDFSERKMYFEVYKGADCTASASSKVIFSEKYDNLLDEKYTYNSSNYRTKAFATQVIDDVRKVRSVGSGTGLSLREYHLQTQVDTNDRTTEQIEASMDEQASLSLSSKTISESFEFAVVADSPFVYRSDYDIGDLVFVKHVAWDIDLTLRISDIEEDYEKEGFNVILTCGSPLPETINFEEV